MIAFSKANTYFEQRNACLLGLSVDSNPSHLAWVYDIYCKTGVRVPFPIIADRNGQIARKYGMIASHVSTTEAVRNVFIIDDNGIVRLILVYPMNIGRCIPEILRALTALQVADSNKLSMPANWVPCQPGIIAPPQTFCELEARTKEIEKNRNGMSWYLTFQNVKDCKEIENTRCKCNEDEDKKEINKNPPDIHAICGTTINENISLLT